MGVRQGQHRTGGSALGIGINHTVAVVVFSIVAVAHLSTLRVSRIDQRIGVIAVVAATILIKICIAVFITFFFIRGKTRRIVVCRRRWWAN